MLIRLLDFIGRIFDAWSGSMLEMFRNIVRGFLRSVAVAGPIGPVILVIEEFDAHVQRMSAVPLALLSQLIVDRWNPPKIFRQRVVTLEEASRAIVEEIALSTVAVAQAGMPRSVDVALRVKSFGFLTALKEALRGLWGRLLHSALVKVWVRLADVTLRTVGSLTTFIVLYQFVQRVEANPMSNTLVDRALSQKNRKVHVDCDRKRKRSRLPVNNP